MRRNYSKQAVKTQKLNEAGLDSFKLIRWESRDRGSDGCIRLVWYFKHFDGDFPDAVPIALAFPDRLSFKCACCHPQPDSRGFSSKLLCYFFWNQILLFHIRTNVLSLPLSIHIGPVTTCCQQVLFEVFKSATPNCAKSYAKAEEYLKYTILSKTHQLWGVVTP